MLKAKGKFFGSLLMVLFVATPVYSENDDGEQPLIIDNSQPAGNRNIPKNVGAKMLDLLTRLNQLETENKQLRGDLETLTHSIKEVKSRQRDLYSEMDKRIRDIELRLKGQVPSVATNTGPRYSTGSVTSPTKSSAKGSSSAPVKKQPVIGSYKPPKASERKAYKRAFALLRKNRFNLAISEFRSFLKLYPNGGYSDTAQYWLAEAYYSSRKYGSAAIQFTKVVQNYPNSPKVAASRVKIGLSYYKLRKYSKARKTLQGVVRDYPGSSSASLARSRLRTMRNEGR
ncbi:TPR repeat containing exported protein; Putative periplasmic protein contains a protein prenylyltransferase domain [hydrothermal vent metagenome]|uniref:TPR repeat containing exported protein Putative periplasmic protein contains a protein prenylyltransferase domain n=1 Tax=hydrothermal vent metagenome TaxID=652676 RepID=A0A3B0YHH6_9ZZZZ